MTLSEFDLIEKYFTDICTPREDVILGVGDDAALLEVAQNQDIVIAAHTLASDDLDKPWMNARAVGHRVLAGALSRLATVGAQPAWASLALSLPAIDTAWLEAFSHGFSGLARLTGLGLVGGDTTHGPLNVTVFCHGLLPRVSLPDRCGAQPGDRIYVTGTPGDAGLAIRLLYGGSWPGNEHREYLLDRLERPMPRIEEGVLIREYASAACSINGGLLETIQHLPGINIHGCILYVEKLPLSDAMHSAFHESCDWALPLTAVGDYELCFTASPQHASAVERRLASQGLECTWIGTVESGGSVRCLRNDGTVYSTDR